MFPDFGSITQIVHITSVFKVVLIATLIVFLIFLLLVFIQIRSLNHIVIQFPYSAFVVFFSILLIVATLALMAVSLAIL